MDLWAGGSATFRRAAGALSVLTTWGFSVRVSRLLSRRSTIAVVALATTAAIALPAAATTTTTTTPAHGFAGSNLTVLQLHLLGQSVTAGRIEMRAGNNHSPHTAQLVITPVSSSVTGPIGQQT